MELKETKPAETIESRDTDKSNMDDKTPRELWEDLGSYSTLHGFHFTFNKSSKLRRVIWILLMLGAAFILANQIHTGWKKVEAHRILVQHHNDYREALDFPAVSICNNNMMKRSQINGTFAQRYLDILGDLKSTAWPNYESGLNHSLNVEEAVLKYGQNLSEILADYKCEWLGRVCTPYQFTPFFDFQYGRCYTFNSGKNSRTILQSRNTGNSHGLSIHLDAQPEEYYGPYSREGTGFRVIVHDQEDYPSMEKSSWQISPGSSVEMKIRRKENAMRESPLKIQMLQLHSLPAPYPKACKNEGGYSQSVCLHNCYRDIILKHCGCQTLGMLRSEPINFPWCTPWQVMHCFYGISALASQKNCNCPVQCYRVKYDVQTSSMYFPSQTFWEIIVQKKNLSSDPQKVSEYQTWFRQRYVKLSVFYGELEAEISKEVPIYDWTDLANDLGGSMGLFLGCSVLTVFEFIDFLILTCLFYWRRMKKINYSMSNGEKKSLSIKLPNQP